MSAEHKHIDVDGCSGCKHERKCPDAFTSVSQYCGNYGAKSRQQSAEKEREIERVLERCNAHYAAEMR